jgi:hypothetical protein
MCLKFGEKPATFTPLHQYSAAGATQILSKLRQFLLFSALCTTEYQVSPNFKVYSYFIKLFIFSKSETRFCGKIFKEKHLSCFKIIIDLGSLL